MCVCMCVCHVCMHVCESSIVLNEPHLHTAKIKRVVSTLVLLLELHLVHH